MADSQSVATSSKEEEFLLEISGGSTKGGGYKTGAANVEV